MLNPKKYQNESFEEVGNILSGIDYCKIQNLSYSDHRESSGKDLLNLRKDSLIDDINNNIITNYDLNA